MALINAGHAVVLKCLGEIEGRRFLDGRTGDGSVGLAPSLDPPFSGTRWLAVDGAQQGQTILRCMGSVEGPRLLDGRTMGAGSVGLAPSTEMPFSGTRWEAIDDGRGSVILKCLGDVEGPRFLDGRTQDGTVGLARGTEPPFSGTHWAVIDMGPAALPPELRFDVDSIAFDGGVPVGGFAHLVMRQDGSFTFTGHFHDSGALEFTTGMVWGVKDLANRLYTFEHTGHVSGTFESGSRDDNWTIDSRNDEIARNWPALAASAGGILRASADADLSNLVNAVIGAAGLVLGVVGIVVAAKP